MNMLSVLDKAIYESLVKGNYRFWHEPAGLTCFKKSCGIPDSYLAWKEQGVIACLVHTYFSAELAYKDRHFMYVGDNTSLVKQEIETRMQSWLSKNPPRHVGGCGASRCS